MIRVTTGSRLHFGLLGLPGSPGDRRPNALGEPVVPAREFGGIGLMVQEPRLALTALESAAWSAEGPLAERALEFARRYSGAGGEGTPPHRFVIESAPPEHRGLGVGTQLALAVAAALGSSKTCPDPDAVALAARVGRGARSAIGIHGFAAGGLLVDGGKRLRLQGTPLAEPAGSAMPAPLVARLPFPEAWPVLLILPDAPAGLHGATERVAFQLLQNTPPRQTEMDALCRLALTGLLPAVIERDFEAFSEALFDFNLRVGRVFAPVQGGAYANPVTAEAVDFLRSEGVRGVGQSSWGPAAFAVFPDPKTATRILERVEKRFPAIAGRIVLTTARNQGALIESM